jgi:serine/threonine-protein kinase RCK2
MRAPQSGSDRKSIFRLCGFEPFWDEAGELAVCRKVVEGAFEFGSPWWDDISDSAKDLITQVGNDI